MRNQLFTSWGEGKKAFLNADGNLIAKKVIEDCYERELDRGVRGNAPLTRVNEATVNPDGWLKMNVSGVVKHTESKTLVKIATHNRLYLNYNDHESFNLEIVLTLIPVSPQASKLPIVDLPPSGKQRLYSNEGSAYSVA